MATKGSEPVPRGRRAPTLRLRRLAAELRTLRASKDLSREEVAARTNLDDATLWRIETARTRPQKRTLLALLDVYEVPLEVRDELIELGRAADQQGWLHAYQAELGEEYASYISFEAEAQSVRNYESLFVPGLLQTADYAHAVIRGVLPTAPDDQVAQLAAVRLERQATLCREKPLRFWAIVDEAALRRMVGGADVMRGQLAHLAACNRQPHITLQVIPFTAGAHPGMPGSFSILGFPDASDMDAVYVDSLSKALFLEAESDVERYSQTFEHLRAIALSPNDSTRLLVTAAEG